MAEPTGYWDYHDKRNSLRPIELTEPNPAEGANLNLDPDQYIPGSVWKLIAVTGAVEYTIFKNIDTEALMAKLTCFFVGLACGYFLRSIIIFILEGL